MLFVGDDWAEDHHDVYLMNEDRRQASVAAATRGPGRDQSVARADCRVCPGPQPRWSSASKPIGACGWMP